MPTVTAKDINDVIEKTSTVNLQTKKRRKRFYACTKKRKESCRCCKGTRNLCK